MSRHLLLRDIMRAEYEERIAGRNLTDEELRNEMTDLFLRFADAMSQGRRQARHGTKFDRL
jgi:hypothetical protein